MREPPIEPKSRCSRYQPGWLNTHDMEQRLVNTCSHRCSAEATVDSSCVAWLGPGQCAFRTSAETPNASALRWAAFLDFTLATLWNVCFTILLPPLIIYDTIAARQPFLVRFNNENDSKILKKFYLMYIRRCEGVHRLLRQFATLRYGHHIHGIMRNYDLHQYPPNLQVIGQNALSGTGATIMSFAVQQRRFWRVCDWDIDCGAHLMRVFGGHSRNCVLRQVKPSYTILSKWLSFLVKLW